MKWTTLRLLGALFAITLVAAACGTDTTETTTDAAAEVTDADAMADEAMDDDAMAMDDDEHDDHEEEHGDHDGHGDEHEGHGDHGSPLEVTEGTPVPEVAIDVNETDTPGTFTIEVSLTNFTITPENIDGDPIDNEGHMHLLLDGEKVERFTELTHTVMVPEGEHLVEVELNANNHQAYAVDGVPIRAGATVTGAGEAMAMEDDEHGDEDHDHDHSSAVGAIEGDLTIDDADVTLVAQVIGGEVTGVENRTQVPLGSIVAITVISDTDDEIHLHGYDILDDVPASDVGLIIFTADTPGRFELELEQAGTFITELEIS
jgi:hypothetical protein